MDHLLLLAGLAGAAMLAFANGANDISKSIATLVGSGESDFRKAVVLVSLAVAAGSILASAWAVKMTLLFTKGLLSSSAHLNQTFAMAVLAGAVGWVLLASRFGWPVSTTHAIVGSVILAGIYAFGFHQVLWSGVTKKIIIPLLVSPIVAFGLSYFIFQFLFWLCRKQYCLNCNWAHWMSAMTSGFARGMNDTPKIASLGFIFYLALDPGQTVASRWLFLLLGVANAVGGMVMGLRTTRTLAYNVTKLDHLDGFAANLATSALVVGTAIYGFPVSTTHVSGSAIMGMGFRKGAASIDWRTVRQIILAWVITLPLAGLFATGTYWALVQL